jgi:hypothetical protein
MWTRIMALAFGQLPKSSLILKYFWDMNLNQLELRFTVVLVKSPHSYGLESKLSFNNTGELS